VSLRAIDLFAGWGGFSTGAQQAGVQVVWAANHSRLAVDVHSANHPGVPHECQDLRQADWSRLPRYDLLLASPACVPLDAQVEMADGTSRAAADLRLGDEVLTHEGRGRPVVNIWSKFYSGPMYSLLMWGDTKRGVRVTGDHLVLARRRGGHHERLGTASFVRADQVRAGDYVAFPRLSEHVGCGDAFVRSRAPGRVTYRQETRAIPSFVKAGKAVRAHTRSASTSSLPGSKIPIDTSSVDLWWLLGHYLGDGQARTDRPQLGWSVGGSAENLARVRSILRALGLRSWTHGPATNVTVFASSTHLYALCVAFGRLCHEKVIPASLARLELHLAEALVRGYLDADGSEDLARANRTLSATSTSLRLLQGIQRLCWRIGWSAGVQIGDMERQTTIQGRLVHCRDSWCLNVVPRPHAQSRTKFDLDPGLVWRSVRKVTCDQVVQEPVLDFEVEEDHTFCLPGVVVHNCQGHSSASQPQRRAYHDAMRSTAWAVVDCADTTEPAALLVENVLDFKKWRLYPQWRAALEGIGYTLSEHRVLAADHGVPQLRERLFIAGTRSGRRFQAPAASPGPRPGFGGEIDWEAGGWRSVRLASPAARARIAVAQRRLGPRCLSQHTSNHQGVPLDEPIRTITTKDQWILVDGNRYRPLTLREYARGMGFEDSYHWPDTLSREDVVRGIGNAVCPPVARKLVSALAEAA
jgi:DNA (cytosine-5)-methyltransferase 1